MSFMDRMERVSSRFYDSIRSGKARDGPRRSEARRRSRTARVVDAAGEEHAEKAIQANYGTFRKIYEGSAGSMDAYYLEVTPR